MKASTVLVAALLLLSFPPAAQEARAESSGLMAATFPLGIRDTSAVWTGTHAYIFGGATGPPSAAIYRYDPATDSLATMPVSLPSARWGTSAVWDGANHAYIFGGRGTLGVSNQVVRYTPSTNTVTTMSGTLPIGLEWTSAIWDGTNAYLFGGLDVGCTKTFCSVDTILRYSPATDTVTTMSAKLPYARDSSSAVWTGTHAYVFGGRGSDQIVRYSTATDTVTIMTARLSGPPGSWVHCCASAVWDGTTAYILGGITGAPGAGLDTVDWYDPATDTVKVGLVHLPDVRQSTSAVWAGKSAYVFGGAGYPTLTHYNTIQRYTPSPLLSFSLAGTLGSNDWYTSASVTVTEACTSPDPITSLKSKVDGGAYAAYTAPFGVSGEGAHAVTGHCTDSTGFQDERGVGFKIDSQPGGGGAISPAAATAAYNVVWTANDATSGVAKVEVQEARAAPAAGAYATVCTATVSGLATATGTCARNPAPGILCYRVAVTDKAGNVFTSAGADPASASSVAAHAGKDCTTMV